MPGSRRAAVGDWLRNSSGGAELYRDLQGFVTEVVDEAGRKLAFRAKMLPVERTLVYSPAGAPTGMETISNGVGTVLLLVHFTCCNPLMLVRNAPDIPIRDAVKWACPRLVRPLFAYMCL